VSFTYHPLTSLVPEMPAKDYKEFLENIRANGQLIPVVVYKDQIIDGRARDRACKELGIQTQYMIYQGEVPKIGQYIVTANTHRRSLSATQKTIVLARFFLAERIVEAEEKGLPEVKRRIKQLRLCGQDNLQIAIELSKEIGPKQGAAAEGWPFCRIDKDIAQAAGSSEPTAVVARKLVVHEPSGADAILNGKRTAQNVIKTSADSGVRRLLTSRPRVRDAFVPHNGANAEEHRIRVIKSVLRDLNKISVNWQRVDRTVLQKYLEDCQALQQAITNDIVKVQTAIVLQMKTAPGEAAVASKAG
jgi:ParB-like chromosome segregation protein Spo0J